jgi:hypothetical protein
LNPDQCHTLINHIVHLKLILDSVIARRFVPKQSPVNNVTTRNEAISCHGEIAHRTPDSASGRCGVRRKCRAKTKSALATLAPARTLALPLATLRGLLWWAVPGSAGVTWTTSRHSAGNNVISMRRRLHRIQPNTDWRRISNCCRVSIGLDFHRDSEIA